MRIQLFLMLNKLLKNVLRSSGPVHDVAQKLLNTSPNVCSRSTHVKKLVKVPFSGRTTLWVVNNLVPGAKARSRSKLAIVLFGNSWVAVGVTKDEVLLFVD
jgi:hypothetical protein